MAGQASKFLADASGNFAIFSAVIAAPLVLVVGLALDVANIVSTRNTLQQAIDSAVLAVAREGKDISDEKAAAIAQQFLDGNFDPSFTKLKVVKNGTAFSVRAEANAGLAFGNLFGYHDWPVQAAASANIAYASYEIALVLDTTGSMKGGKLSSLKGAVLGLIDTMSTQVNDDEKLKFAMVPFATFVNVGPQYAPAFDQDGKQVAGTGAPWLDLTGKSTVPQSELDSGASRFQLYGNLGQTWPGCVETRYSAGDDYDVDDTPPDPSDAQTLYVPAFGIDEPDSSDFTNSYIKSDAKPKKKTAAEKKKRWAKYGVATDAGGNPLNGGLIADVVSVVTNNGNGKKKTIPIDNGPSKGDGKPMGPQHGCDVQPISPLTNDYEGLMAKVEMLEANGTTNIMEGVAWGLRVLSPAEPFSDSKGKNSVGAEQIMIVLTDGSNVFGNTTNDLGSSYSSYGYLVDGRVGAEGGGSGTTTSLMNDKTLKACANAKAAGIEIYTIRLEEPNMATGTMLKECASAPDHFIDVPNRSQLDEAFETIKQKIIRVRIAS